MKTLRMEFTTSEGDKNFVVSLPHAKDGPHRRCGHGSHERPGDPGHLRHRPDGHRDGGRDRPHLHPPGGGLDRPGGPTRGPPAPQRRWNHGRPARQGRGRPPFPSSWRRSSWCAWNPGWRPSPRPSPPSRGFSPEGAYRATAPPGIPCRRTPGRWGGGGIVMPPLAPLGPSLPLLRPADPSPSPVGGPGGAGAPLGRGPGHQRHPMRRPQPGGGGASRGACTPGAGRWTWPAPPLARGTSWPWPSGWGSTSGFPIPPGASSTWAGAATERPPPGPQARGAASLDGEKRFYRVSWVLLAAFSAYMRWSAWSMSSSRVRPWPGQRTAWPVLRDMR